MDGARKPKEATKGSDDAPPRGDDPRGLVREAIKALDPGAPREPAAAGGKEPVR
jgi:hypothetical protein